MGSYPQEHIVAGATDEETQARGWSELDEWMRGEMKLHEDECREAGAPASLKWFLFCSPDWTWRSECGREGWMLLDPEDDYREYAYFEYLMS